MTVPSPYQPRLPGLPTTPAQAQVIHISPLEIPMGITGRPMPVLPRPVPLLTHGPAYVLALCNQKGGVGKTTTTINTGAALAEAGRRVLLVDMDPQGSLSAGVGVRALTGVPTVYDVLMDAAATPASRAVVKTQVPGMDLLPADIRLSAAELRLAGEMSREYVLDRALESVRASYDYILIDCMPALGLLTVNALTASNGVIIPTECEYFALRGVSMLRDTILKVQQRLNNKLHLDGVLVTMVEGRTAHARESMTQVLGMFGDDVLHSGVARSVKFPESARDGVPVLRSAPTSPGAIAYRNLAWEIVDRLVKRGVISA